MTPIVEFLRLYPREIDFYQEAARLCAALCEQDLRTIGKRVIVTHRAKRPDRLAEKLEQRNPEKQYKTAQEIAEDSIDLAGVRIALYFPGDQGDVDAGSGATKREAREKLLEPARRREIDVVPVWRLDRWGRSVTDLLATLQELEHLGVGFVSLPEALDLTTPAGRAMTAMLAVFAAFEREILQERTRAGLAQARLSGKRLGRPLTAGLQSAEIRKLHRAGISKSEIAR